MKDIGLIESKSKLTEEEIKSFENYVGDPLPRDYVEFLLQNNGGRATVPNYCEAQTGAQVGVFNFFSLSEMAGATDPGIGVVQIGRDIGNQEICLALRGAFTGQVFVIINKNPHPIASTFTAFIEGLREEPTWP
jgi:SMI1 / KNR4 family (SUKH-1)